MPDKDQFAQATRKARAAFIVVEEAELMPGESPVGVDQYTLATFLGTLFTVSGGLPSLSAVLEAARELADAPLLARDPNTMSRVLDAIDAAVDLHGRTDLDLVLRRAATRAALAGRYSPRDIVERFFGDTITRYAIEAKRGLIDRLPADVLTRERAQIEKAMLPVIRDAALLVVNNPNLKRLQLAARQRREDIDNTNFWTGNIFNAANE